MVEGFGGSCSVFSAARGILGGVRWKRGWDCSFDEDGERDVSRMPPTVREAGTVRYMRVWCPFNAREQAPW